jgi:hypothetical protein
VTVVLAMEVAVVEVVEVVLVADLDVPTAGAVLVLVLMVGVVLCRRHAFLLRYSRDLPVCRPSISPPDGGSDGA